MKNRKRIHDDWATPEYILEPLRKEFGMIKKFLFDLFVGGFIIDNSRPKDVPRIVLEDPPEQD